MVPMSHPSQSPGYSDVRSDGYLSLAVGDACVGVRCSDPGIQDRMAASYRSFLVERPPEYTIDLNLHDYLTAGEVSEVIRNIEAHCDGSRFFTHPWLIDCYLDRKMRQVRVETERELFAAQANYKLMNHLLRGLYYSIFKWLRDEPPDAYLMHGCGVISDGRAYLFTGPSGIGKTTVASLAGGRKVLNDETVLVGRNGSGIRIVGTPFDGGVAERSPDSETLSAAFLLRQADRVELRRLNGGEAYRGLLAQVLDSSPLFDIRRLEYLPERADLSAAIAAGVPAYELSFRPDTTFWEAVENCFDMEVG